MSNIQETGYSGKTKDLLLRFAKKFGCQPPDFSAGPGSGFVVDDPEQETELLSWSPKQGYLYFPPGKGGREVTEQEIEQMISSGKLDETTAGAVGGFQVPLGIKKRKSKVDEAISLNPDINEGLVLSYLNGMSEQVAEGVGRWLDEGDYVSFANAVLENAFRQMVRSRVREVVRKKAGGGGYVLYSPNQGKKKQAKPVGNFPTKLGAKKAELARFPPKDPGKLKRLRKEIDRLLKDPKKRAEKERAASKEKGTDTPHEKKPHTKAKKEGVDHRAATLAEDRKMLAYLVRSYVNESLFREERTGSDWDEYIGRLSKQALTGDKRFQGLQKGIEKKTEKVLKDALSAIAKSVDRKKVKIKDLGVRAHAEQGKTYLAFSATVGQAKVEPIAIYIEGGVPKIELSDQAKAALTEADPNDSRLFRADLVAVQERVLDRMDELEKAVIARDRYLEKLEDNVDGFVAGLSPLEVSLLKQVLVKKYRKIS